MPEPEHGLDMNLRSFAKEQRDWSASLNLVHKAGVSFREAEDQTQMLVSRAQAILEKANQELETAYEGIAAAEEKAQAAAQRAERAEARATQAEAQVQMAEARAKAAETRAELAEGRAMEAEEWLQRMHEAIVNEFLLNSVSGANENAASQTGDGSALAERVSDVIHMRHSSEMRRLKAV